MAIDRLDGRRHDIDALRVLSFGTVIIYHASLLYGTRTWLLNSDEPSRLMDLIHFGSNPWRMSLLFFISGLVTASLLKRKSIGEIRSSRTRQLLPPFLLGIVLVVPPQFYFSDLRSAPDLTYWEFLKSYFAAGLTMEHLWFLAYLWIYVFVWSIGYTRLERHWPRLSSGLASLLTGVNLFVVPVVFFTALRIWLFPVFGQTLVVTTDLYAHVQYFSMFVSGALLVNQPRFWQEIDRQLWMALGLAIASFVPLAIIALAWPHDQLPSELVVVLRILRSIFQWCSIIALLAIFGRIASRPNPVVTYLNRSMMTYYIMHQTIIVILAYYIGQAGMLDIWSFVPVVIITALICALLAEMKKLALACYASLVSKLSTSRRLPPNSPPSEVVG